MAPKAWQRWWRHDMARKVDVVDGVVRVNVLPTRKAGEWIEEVKRRKGKA